MGSDDQGGGDSAGRYDAFMSYSHAADGLLAPRLQAGLQRFAKPWWKRRAMRVFRDETSLSATPHLWSSITDALDASAWFVLLLSPEAAQSEWINKEIEYWTQHKGTDHILPVVTEGEFRWDADDEVSPQALKFDEEPRWVDLRFARSDEQLDLRNARFRGGVADIASAVRNIPKDDLEGEEVRQHRKTMQTASIAIAALVALVVVASVFGVVARSERDRADDERLRAEIRELAAASLSAQDIDEQLSVLLALEAVERGGEAVDLDALQALHTAASNQRLVAEERGGIDVAFWPDGIRFLTGGSAFTVHDADSAAPIHSDQIDGSEFHTAVAVSPDGSLYAVAAVDGDEFPVVVYEAVSHRELRRFDDHEDRVISIAFAGDDTLTTASWDFTVRIRSLSTGETSRTWRLNGGAWTLAVGPGDDPLIAYGDWSTNNPRLAESSTSANDAVVLEGHFFLASDLVVGTEFIYTSSFDGHARRFDQSGRLTLDIDAHEGAAQAIAWNPAREILITGADDGTAKVWNLAQGGSQLVAVVRSETGRIVAVAASPDGSRLVTVTAPGADGHGVVSMWDISPGGPGEVFNLESEAHWHGDVAFSADGRWIVGSRGEGDVGIWSAGTGDLLNVMDDAGLPTESGPSGILNIAIAPDGSTLATGTVDGSEVTGRGVIWNGQTFRLMHELGDDRMVHDVVYSLDSAFLYWGTQDGVYRQSTSTGQILDMTDGMIGEVSSMDVSPDGDLLLIRYDDDAGDRVEMWNLADFTMVWEGVHESGRWDSSVDFAPDGRSVLTTGVDLIVWDAARGEQLWTLDAHPGGVQSAEFSPDGARIATSGTDLFTRIWSVETREEIATLGTRPIDVHGLSWSPDGRHLSTIGTDGFIRVWAVDVAELIDIARSRLTRSLTGQECRTYLHTECRDS